MRCIISNVVYNLLVILTLIMSFASPVKAGWGWSPAVQNIFLNTPSYANPVSPDVVVGKDGVSTAIWTVNSEAEKTCSVKVARHNGRTWDVPTLIGYGCSDRPARIVKYGDGRLLAVWESGGFGDYHLESSAFNGGVWGDVIRLSGKSTGHINFDVSSNFSGSVALIQALTDDHLIYKVEYSQIGESGWSPSEVVGTSKQAGFLPLVSSVVSDDGVVTAVWSEGDYVNAAVRRDNSWGISERIGYSSSNINSIKSVIDKVGAVTTVWSGQGVQSSTYYNGVWGNQEYVSRDFGPFAIGLNEYGSPMLAWGESGSVYYSLYESGMWTAKKMAHEGGVHLSGLFLSSSVYGANLYLVKSSSCRLCPISISIESMRYSLGMWGSIYSHAAYSTYGGNLGNLLSVSVGANGYTMLVWSSPELINSQNASDPAPTPRLYELSLKRNGSGGVVLSNPVGIECGSDCTRGFFEGSIVMMHTNQACVLEWGGACSGQTCDVAIDGDKEAIVYFKKLNNLLIASTGQGVVSAYPSGTNCGIGYENSYEPNTIVKMYATAEPLWGFKGWIGDCAGQDQDTCLIEMDANKSVEGIFNTSTLSVNKSGSGLITSDQGGAIYCGTRCTANFKPGTLIVLTPNISERGYIFSGWSGDCSGSSVCNLDMTNDKNVTAAFTALAIYKMKVKRLNGGTIESQPYGINCGEKRSNVCVGEFYKGENVLLEAKPRSGLVVKSWRNCPSADGNNCRLNMTGNVSGVSVVYGKAPKYKVSVEKSKAGIVEIWLDGRIIKKCGEKTTDCQAKIEAGKTVEIKAKPESGRSYRWSGSCAGTDSSTCWVTMDSNKLIGIMFE